MTMHSLLLNGSQTPHSARGYTHTKLLPRSWEWSIGYTVFMDGSCTLLDSEAPPWLVFGDWTISVHYEVLRFAVFLNEKLDL